MAAFAKSFSWIVHWNEHKMAFHSNFRQFDGFSDTSLMRQSGFRYIVYEAAENKQHFTADVGGSWKCSEKHKHTTITNDSRIFSSSNGKEGRKGNIETQTKQTKKWSLSFLVAHPSRTQVMRWLMCHVFLFRWFCFRFARLFYATQHRLLLISTSQFMNMILWYIFMTSVWYVNISPYIVCYDLLTCCCLVLPIIS